MFIAVLFILMLLMVAFSFLEDERPIVKWSVYMTAVIIITLMAGLRPIGIDKDSLNYLGYYWGTSDDIVENSFLYIAEFVRYVFDDVQWIFIIYALIAIPLKCFAFTKLSNEVFLVLAVYMCNFMILHDMTQIRIGAGMAFVFWGFYYLIQGKRWPFVILTLVASFLHVSALLLLLIVFFRNNELKKWHRIVMAIIPLVTLLTVSVNIDVVALIPFDFIQSKLQIYEELRDSGVAGDERLNLLNAASLLKLLVFYLLLWKYDLLKEKCSYLTLLLKTYVLSYFCLGIFSFMAILATRVSEVFGFVEILMIPLIVHLFEPKWLARIFVLVFVVGIFLLNIVYAQLLVI